MLMIVDARGPKLSSSPHAALIITVHSPIPTPGRRGQRRCSRMMSAGAGLESLAHETAIMSNVHPTQKRLNEMNRLGDMAYFPAFVNMGATINVFLTILLTWWVEPQYPALAGVFVAVVLAVNLLPVALLRLKMRADDEFHTLGEMQFFGDQHRFSDWVYVVASANMAFWILLTWTVSALHRSNLALATVEIVAALATFSPVLFRWVKKYIDAPSMR